MANKLVKWKPGATGLYESHTMGKTDWEGLGFEDDDTAPVVFSRSNNFTVVGDKLPGVQLDFFESNGDFQVKEIDNPQVVESKAAAVTRAGLTNGSSEPQMVDFSEEGSGEPKTAASKKSNKAQAQA